MSKQFSGKVYRVNCLGALPNPLKQNLPAIFLLVILLLQGAAVIAQAAEGNAGSTLFSGNAPIEITSEMLTADNLKNIAVFKGSVTAIQGKTTLNSDWMKVLYSESGDIIEIHSKGSVKLMQEGKTITSEEAAYYSNKGEIIFTGSPVAKDGRSTITGSRMTYFEKDGSSIVENPKVVLNKSRGQTK